MGREGFEPSKAEPTDLQSAPFDHSGISPIDSAGPRRTALGEIGAPRAGARPVQMQNVRDGDTGKGNRCQVASHPPDALIDGAK